MNENYYEPSNRQQNKNTGSTRKRKKKKPGCAIAFWIFLFSFILIMAIVGWITTFRGITAFFTNESSSVSGKNSSENSNMQVEQNVPLDTLDNGDDNSSNPKESSKRLDAFIAKNPTLSKSEATWMINVNMDLEEIVEAILLTKEDLGQLYVIVSKRFQVPDDYVPDDLVKLTERDSVRIDTKVAFDTMRAAASSEGYKISPASGFRTVEYQKNLYNRYLKTDSLVNVDTYSARPGLSEHHTGMVIDVIGSNGDMTAFGETKESLWVDENAHKYGFIVRYLPETVNITGYKSEPWHLRYVGVEIATVMKNQNIKTLEEYVGKYIINISNTEG